MSGVQMMSGPDTTSASLTYTRDGNGQVVTETPSGLPGTAVAYTYDQRRRLTAAGGASYAYDAASNPTEVDGQTATYDAASQLQQLGTTTYTENQVGERTLAVSAGGPTTSYNYNQADELTAVSRTEDAPVADTYAYDGDGIRASKTASGGSTTQFTWDVSNKQPLLLSDGQTSYIYGPADLPVEQIGGSSSDVPSFYHHDALGSTRMLTDATGRVSATFTYTAYGSPSGATGTATTPFGWAGEYRDADTGLVYLRARYYDPQSAQFISVDPDLIKTLTAYSYAQDDPVNATDPTGRYTFTKDVKPATAIALGILLSTITDPASLTSSLPGGVLTTLTQSVIRLLESMSAGQLRIFGGELLSEGLYAASDPIDGHVTITITGSVKHARYHTHVDGFSRIHYYY